jgi:hypothetical protein
MITGKTVKNISLREILFWLSVIMMLHLTSAYCQGKENILESLTGKFEKQCYAISREEVYIQTNRDIYISGEDIFFEAYLTGRHVTIKIRNIQL